MIYRGNDPRLYPPTSPYSQVVSDDHYVFLSGVVAADIPGGDVLRGDICAETRLILSTIRDLLHQHGTALHRVLRVDVYLADLAEIGAMDAVYQEFFAGHLPARTCTGATELCGGCRVEITVMAQRGDGIT